jgi:hypothetical protein
MTSTRTLPDLAAELGVTYQAAYARALRGELGRLERRGARWIVVQPDPTTPTAPPRRKE